MLSREFSLERTFGDDDLLGRLHSFDELRDGSFEDVAQRSSLPLADIVQRVDELAINGGLTHVHTHRRNVPLIKQQFHLRETAKRVHGKLGLLRITVVVKKFGEDT